MAPLVVLGVAAAAGAGGLAYHRAKQKKGMTPERKKIFENAIKTITDPEKLKALATAYEKEGLRAWGAELRKRAALREMPEAKKDARRVAYKKGMASNDPAKINRLAAAFHKEGAYGAAQNLRDYAKGLSSRVEHIFQHGPPAAPAAATPAAHGDSVGWVENPPLTEEGNEE